MLAVTITIPDLVTFVLAAAIVLVAAIGVVVSRSPVHAALCLVATLFGIAVLFVEQNAEFLAAVQVIVYAGAIVVLFLFVIMLLGVDREEAIGKDPLRAQRPLGVLLGLLVLAEVLVLSRLSWPIGQPHVAGPVGGPSSNVADLARAVFTTYLLPFEITSALLLIATVGAVVLARRPPRSAGQPGAATGQPSRATGQPGGAIGQPGGATGRPALDGASQPDAADETGTVRSPEREGAPR